jgi:hypothetical protein
LIPAVIIAMSVCWADYTLAGTAREAAKAIYRIYKDRPNVVWFEGHWGFQYYMEANNSKPLDYKNPKIKIGDIIITPINNTYPVPLREEMTFVVQRLRFIPCRWLSTVNPPLGASFYSSAYWGPMPFAFGRTSTEDYSILAVKKFQNK